MKQIFSEFLTAMYKERAGLIAIVICTFILLFYAAIPEMFAGNFAASLFSNLFTACLLIAGFETIRTSNNLQEKRDSSDSVINFICLELEYNLTLIKRPTRLKSTYFSTAVWEKLSLDQFSVLVPEFSERIIYIYMDLISLNSKQRSMITESETQKMISNLGEEIESFIADL